MTWLTVFLMFCSFGAGVCWSIIWTNMKALDETIRRYRKEERELEAKFKQGAEQIISEVQQPSTNDLKAQVLKKKH